MNEKHEEEELLLCCLTCVFCVLLPVCALFFCFLPVSFLIPFPSFHFLFPFFLRHAFFLICFLSVPFCFLCALLPGMTASSLTVDDYQGEAPTTLRCNSSLGANAFLSRGASFNL